MTHHNVMRYKIFYFFILCAFLGCSSLPKSENYGKVLEEKLEKKKNPKEIVFIHGMFMTPQSWQAWQKYFEKAGYKTSAPAWPLHDLSLGEQRDSKNYDQLAKLKLDDVLAYYRQILASKKEKPILIGHSMGGLIAQILLSEGLADAAVAIDSAPPSGVFVISWSFLRSNWGAVSPFASLDKPIVMDQDQFNYAFANAQSEDQQKLLFETYAVPESRRVGKGPLSDAGKVDDTKARGPLLIVAGEKDHIIPAKLNYANFEKYEETPAYTEFYLAAGRDHSTAVSPGWENVAAETRRWIENQFKK